MQVLFFLGSRKQSKLQGGKSVQLFPARNTDQINFLIHNIWFGTDAIRVRQKVVEEFSQLSFMFLLTNEYLCHVKLHNINALDRSDEARMVFYGSDRGSEAQRHK